MSIQQPPASMDRALGEALERGLRAHHRRRLNKIGWVTSSTSRARLTMATPYERAMPSESASTARTRFKQSHQRSATLNRTYISPVGRWRRASYWWPSPRSSLSATCSRRPEQAPKSGPVWGGAHRHRSDPAEARQKSSGEQLSPLNGVTVALDLKERLLHCHHEKIVVIDDEVAFVGGLDFSTIGASRLDASDHPPREPMGWHDATVELRGPIVADVADHFSMRWKEVTGNALGPVPEPAPAGDVEVQIVRTVPEKVYGSLPNGDFGILGVYVKALRSARKFIYLENQFLWSSEIVKLLAQKLSNPPTDDFRLVVLLPSKPSTGNDDTLGQLAVLAEADHDNRFLACTLYGTRRWSCPSGVRPCQGRHHR